MDTLNVSLDTSIMLIFPPGPSESNVDIVIWEPCPGHHNIVLTSNTAELSVTSKTSASVT